MVKDVEESRVLNDAFKGFMVRLLDLQRQQTGEDAADDDEERQFRAQSRYAAALGDTPSLLGKSTSQGSAALLEQMRVAASDKLPGASSASGFGYWNETKEAKEGKAGESKKSGIERKSSEAIQCVQRPPSLPEVLPSLCHVVSFFRAEDNDKLQKELLNTKLLASDADFVLRDGAPCRQRHTGCSELTSRSALRVFGVCVLQV